MRNIKFLTDKMEIMNIMTKGNNTAYIVWDRLCDKYFIIMYDGEHFNCVSKKYKLYTWAYKFIEKMGFDYSNNEDDISFQLKHNEIFKNNILAQCN